jgi:hypothetical protein
MRWFRSNRVFGAQAALFALVIQFILAFGHVHVRNAVAHAIAPAAAAFNITPDEPNSPAPSDHDQNSPDGLCAICATIHLTGSAQIAAAPELLLPITYRLIDQPLASDSTLDDLRCLDLRSRGPPQI